MVETRSQKKRKREEEANSQEKQKEPRVDSSKDRDELQEPLNLGDEEVIYVYESEDNEENSDGEKSDEEMDSSDWIAQFLSPEDMEDIEDPDYNPEDGEVISLNYAGLCKLLGATGQEKIAENLKNVMETIKDKTPNFMKILSENVQHEHRVKLVELYEALKELETAGMSGQPSKLEYISLRDHIN